MELCARSREPSRLARAFLIQRCRSVRAKSRIAPARWAKCTRVVPGGTLPCIGRLPKLWGRAWVLLCGLDFEWYYCRGAFFHNDAHYDARLFGVWCIEGPPMQLVFPRAALRLAVTATSVVVFDPFEVHGVLAPGCNTYAANDYLNAEASVFVGFELDITPTTADAFDIEESASGPVISSRTRINATSGAIESFD